jgi:hypothetical protein
MPEYTFEEFSKIAVTKLRQENVDVSTAKVIAEKVCNELGSRDTRDVTKAARLADSIDDIHFVVKMLNKQKRTERANHK